MSRVNGVSSSARRANVQGRRARPRRRNPRSGRPSAGPRIRDPTYRISRTTSLTGIVNQSTGVTIGAQTNFDLQFAVSLANLYTYVAGVNGATTAFPNATDFSNLFDEYTIERVTFEIFFSNNNSSTASATVGLPLLWHVEDYDSVDATNLSAIQQYQNVRRQYMGEHGGGVLHHSLRPHMLRTTADNAGTMVARNVGNYGDQWLDTATTTIPFYGLKIVYDPCGTSSNTNIGFLNIVVKADYAFRRPK